MTKVRYPLAILAVLWLASAAVGYPITPYAVDNGHQDHPIVLCPHEHEVGDQPPFPNDEWVRSLEQVETLFRPCLEAEDNPLIPNIKVKIQNMTGGDIDVLFYVADTGTSLTNDDGLIGNAGLGDAQLAFRIDSVGKNIPLVFESMLADNIFQAGEIWCFVIQDFAGQGGRNATPFDSLGIASQSPSGLSTGSLITPEPATMSLLAVGGLVLFRRRRSK